MSDQNQSSASSAFAKIESALAKFELDKKKVESEKKIVEAKKNEELEMNNKIKKEIHYYGCGTLIKGFIANVLACDNNESGNNLGKLLVDEIIAPSDNGLYVGEYSFRALLGYHLQIPNGLPKNEFVEMFDSECISGTDGALFRYSTKYACTIFSESKNKEDINFVLSFKKDRSNNWAHPTLITVTPKKPSSMFNFLWGR